MEATRNGTSVIIAGAMRRRAILVTLMSALTCGQQLHAQQQDTEKTALVEEMLVTMKLEQNVPEIVKQIDAYITSQVEQSINSLQMNTGDRRRASEDLQAFNKRLLTVTTEGLAWEKIKPLYVRVYSDTFSIEELQGALAFFKTPVGQAWNAKTSTLASAMMQATQERMTALTPVIQKMSNDFIEDVRRRYGAR